MALTEMTFTVNSIKNGWKNFRCWTTHFVHQKRKDDSQMFVSSKDQGKAFIFFNCDAEKSQQSMNVFYNHAVYRNLRNSRRALWDKIKDEIDQGRVQVNDADRKQLRYEILEGDPVKASDFITYGAIIQVNFI